MSTCFGALLRVLPVLDNLFKRMRALAGVGIHTMVNGPITYTIDGAPLVGPIPGKRNAFCIISLRAGTGEGGGHGGLLALKIVHGEAQGDTWVTDPRRLTGTCQRGTDRHSVMRSALQWRYPFSSRMVAAMRSCRVAASWARFAAEYTRLVLEVIGQPTPATVVPECP